MILDRVLDYDEHDKMDRLMAVVFLGMVFGLIFRFVEFAYKTTLLQ